MKRLWLLLAFLLSLIVCFNPDADAKKKKCGDSCGEERWAIKVLTDSRVENINFTPVNKSIQWLRSRERPPKLPSCTRLIGIETMTFRVRGVIKEYTVEDDKDFHIVIANPNNMKQTMIIEIIDPSCPTVKNSNHLEDFKIVRKEFLKHFVEPTVVSSFINGEKTSVEVEGVGFFDRMHDQRGRALPSGVELHPVLSFKVLE